jgi:hypothetical protein
MRALLVVFMLCFSILANAQTPPAKESLAATFTRGKKLQGRVTVDVKEAPLKEVLANLSVQLQDQKLGPVVVSADAALLAKPVTLSVKNKHADEVIAGLLKTLGLGYTIISKPNDPTDGWLLIDKFGPKSEQPKPEQEKPKATEEDEKLAAVKLETAKLLQKEKEIDRAKTVLKFLIKNYPGTTAAEEAEAMLEKLSK